MCELCAHSAHVQKKPYHHRIEVQVVSMRFSLTEAQRATSVFGRLIKSMRNHHQADFTPGDLRGSDGVNDDFWDL